MYYSINACIFQQETQKLPIFFLIRGADCLFNSCYTATTDVGEVAKPLILLGLLQDKPFYRQRDKFFYPRPTQFSPILTRPRSSSFSPFSSAYFSFKGN